MHDIDRTTLEVGDDGEVGDFEARAGEAGIDEAQELELSDELLAIESEEELDQFIGALIPRLAKGMGALIKSPIGKRIGGFLKGAAKRILPMAGKIGRSLLGLELEGLSPEDQELEVAQQFIRLAAEATRQAALSGDGDPDAVARRAVRIAARKYAPGLLVPPVSSESEDEVVSEEMDDEDAWAAELLALEQEEEIGPFIGRMLARVGAPVLKRIVGPAGEATKKWFVKQLAKITAQAIGNMDVPAAPKSGEEREMEEEAELDLARRLVRFARSAAGYMDMGRGGDPRAAARRAIAISAHVHLPELRALRRAAPAEESGRWERRPEGIVLLGL